MDLPRGALLFGDNGCGLAESALYDERGLIGRATQSLGGAGAVTRRIEKFLCASLPGKTAIYTQPNLRHTQPLRAFGSGPPSPAGDANRSEAKK